MDDYLPPMDELALYIHWPFCLAKCPYCDFNSHVRDRIPQQRFAAALRAELAWEAARLGRRRLTSIFFGGGTPSLMEPSTVAALIEDATRLFHPAGDIIASTPLCHCTPPCHREERSTPLRHCEERSTPLCHCEERSDEAIQPTRQNPSATRSVPPIEITLEANPTSVEAGRLAEFRAAGVNRISLGVQSLDPSALAMLGRQHSAVQAIAALETARGLFQRLSFDLIYARPGQSLAEWRTELRAALALAADHLSLYQLTIEPGTAFEAQYRRGAIILPDPDTAAALYEATQEEAARFGLLGYEVSNYAVPGSESRHNLSYWRYGDYAGIGPGAHGRIMLDGILLATRRHRAPESWAARVERMGHGTMQETPLTVDERAREMLLMGLRLSEGVFDSRFRARTGKKLADAVDPEILDRAISENYLLRTAESLRATAEGRLRLDALLASLLR